MKKIIILIVTLSIGLAGCIESDIVMRFSGRQVEQLFTDGDIKTWIQTSLIIDGEPQVVSSCQDTIRWVFEVIDADSIASYELIFDDQCIFYDTAFLGAFSASDFEGVFTDSLKFEKGNPSVMTPLSIRSGAMSVRYIQNQREIVASFEKTRSEILARQVGSYLTGGIDAGNAQDWYLTSLNVADTVVELTDCRDSTIFRFSRLPNAMISLNEFMIDELCQPSNSIAFGNVTFPTVSNEGFFEGQLNLDGSITDAMVISSFTTQSFVATYFRQSDTVRYRGTYIKLD